MPTLEIENSDQVFIVRGRDPLARGGLHYLQPNTLIVVMQVLDNQRAIGRVWIGGDRVTGFSLFTFTMESGFGPCSSEFRFNEPMNHAYNTIRRLEPFVAIREPSDNPSPAPMPDPVPLEDDGDRPSRFQRDPVI